MAQKKILSTDDLEDTPTEDLTTKTATSQYLFDHAADTSTHGVADLSILDDDELIATLAKRGNWFQVPTALGWTVTKTGAGAEAQGVFFQYVNAGNTASGTCLLYVRLYTGWRPTSTNTQINWDKKIILVFNYCRVLSDAQVVARVQLKTVNTIGALSASGIGIRVDNLTLVGESYGSEIGELDLSTALTHTNESQIVIIHDPATTIKWYVNGTLKGTQSTAAKIPSSTSGAAYLMNSIINGAQSDDYAYSYIGQPKIWGER